MYLDHWNENYENTDNNNKRVTNKIIEKYQNLCIEIILFQTTEG
jgi:hypothetical protein